MPIFEKISKYSASVGRSDLTNASRRLRLKLASGETASLEFVPTPPSDWLTFDGSRTTAFLSVDEYDAAYHLLQTERPVFFTALNLEGFRAAFVHTELDLSHGEPTGEGYNDKSLEALIVRARKAEREGSKVAPP